MPQGSLTPQSGVLSSHGKQKLCPLRFKNSSSTLHAGHPHPLVAIFPFTVLGRCAFSTFAGSKTTFGTNQSVCVCTNFRPSCPWRVRASRANPRSKMCQAFRLRVAAQMSKSALRNPLCICLSGTSDGSLTPSRKACSDFSTLHPFRPHKF